MKEKEHKRICITLRLKTIHHLRKYCYKYGYKTSTWIDKLINRELSKELKGGKEQDEGSEDSYQE